jgi:hypothetical protein
LREVPLHMPTMQNNKNSNPTFAQSALTKAQRKVTMEEVEDKFWATIPTHANLVGGVMFPLEGSPKKFHF